MLNFNGFRQIENKRGNKDLCRKNKKVQSLYVTNCFC